MNPTSVSTLDPSVLLGLTAALGGIGVVIRHRARLLAGPCHCVDRARERWLTEAAAEISERCVIASYEPYRAPQNALIDRRPRQVVNLTGASAPGDPTETEDVLDLDSAARQVTALDE